MVRRIILENEKPYTTTQDNTILYFCGFTDGNSGDMLFGHLISNDMTSLTLKLVFQYGSPKDEFTFTSSSTVPNSYGDCVLSEDNAYLLAVMSTQFQTTRPSNINKYEF